MGNVKPKYITFYVDNDNKVAINMILSGMEHREQEVSIAFRRAISQILDKHEEMR